MELSKQLVLTLAVEGFLMAMTLFLLTEPGWILKSSSEKQRRYFFVCGMISLCFTFCWSFVLGCLIAMHRLTLSPF